MKKLIAILILLSFAAPVRAGLVTDFDPVEKKLLDSKITEEQLNQDFKKQQAEPAKVEEKKSNWWKWVLGIVIVGGAAAAASGGHGGGGSSGGGGSTTGGATASW
jgi:hypothetical protein